MSASTGSAVLPGSTLLAYPDFVKRCDVVLASKSPRRKEIFEMMGLAQTRIIVSTFAEDFDKSLFPEPGEYARASAQKKAEEIALQVLPNATGPTVVVGSDTIVDLNGRILEKPDGEEGAFNMLRDLSGQQHKVHSGVAIYTQACGPEAPAKAFYTTTTVSFSHLTDEEINEYIKTGEPMDKAGAYGIQGIGGQFVAELTGSYFNVMGFPMREFSVALGDLIKAGKV
ncbi:unnamed protein product [Chrysoparadoxa australica]